MKNRFKNLKAKAAELKKYISAVYYAGRHPKLPVSTRILIVFTIAYALSPVDLIPDFIPVIGYLDDLLLLPALIALCIKKIPGDIMSESLKKAEEQPLSLKKNWKAGAVIIGIWLVIIVRVIFIFI